ncbi:DASH complex, subunit Spc34 [Rhizodiscina lignyota]|uniref:DASH complex subunit SPC34 n=1 Tax=Rhizodiscina lignyota TaxID=1504668 RepID=A0A9P4IIJ7_9PEZI|nr:DASH complex, subunit Spc34 [Rhizodiscina lignyota]
MSAISLIDAHLEQISLCSASIAELSFPSPKIFSNALLRPHDITALIRDTEAHERALFSVPPPAPVPRAQDPSASNSRRNTTFNPNGGNNAVGGGGANAVRAPRRNTAVAAVLGGDLVERIRKGGGGGAGTGLGYRSYNENNKGEVDVDVLLEGAEKLCAVYPIPGAMEKVHDLRQRHVRLAESIEYYEARAKEQASKLQRLHRPRDFETEDDEEDTPSEQQSQAAQEAFMPEVDVKKEEEEIRELERKRQILEERVNALGRDITGVLR